MVHFTERLRQEFAYQYKLLVHTCTVSMEDGGEGEDGSKRRVLRVLSLLRQFGEPELWRHVRDDILKDGELDVSDVMHSAKLPDLTFLLASGAATDVTCLK